MSVIIAKLKLYNITTLLIANSFVDPNDFCNDYPQLNIVQMARNMGTAFAYNTARLRCLADINIRFLLLLDQDSIPSDDYLEFCISLSSKVEWLQDALYCPRDKKNVASGFNIKSTNQCCEGYPLREVFDAKSSGLLIPANILKTFSFDEKLYVDYVDWEYCWRVRRAGAAIFELLHLTLNDHQLGNPYRFRCSQKIFYFPSLSRRLIQTRSAAHMAINFRKFFAAPIWRVVAILSRLIVNPILDGLEMVNIIVPVDNDS